MADGPDIVIIGSGMGGATLAAALAPSGVRIAVLERGQRLEHAPECRDTGAIFARGVFRPDETWETPGGEVFNPGNFYVVGGNSKMYGAVLLRFREQDFAETTHLGGTSPAWPVPYAEFEPWYQAAEEMYEVHGVLGEDPTEPPHSGTYPHPPVPDEAPIARVRARLRDAGVTPSSLPLGVDIDVWLKGGATPWDGHPGSTPGKMDAETIGIARATAHENVELITGARVDRLIAGAGNRIEAVEYVKDGNAHRLAPRIVVLSAGAVNSAVTLLRSADETSPNGLANSSDLVGRRFMNHNCSALLSIHPFWKNPSIYQKTLQFNDFYTSSPQGAPLGNVQLLGKISTEILTSQAGLPRPLAALMAARSFDWYLMSEDLPSLDSRVSLRGDRIVLDWQRSNWQAHEALVAQTKRVLRKAGFPILLAKAFDRKTPSHQCGTAVFGNDPKTSVLDLFCRTHDHPNLYVVDASFLPTSAAVNPALTIAAQALRVADHIQKTELAP